MLTIVVPERELFDESTSRITVIKEQKLQLEHSLVSMSKWESRWEIPFLGKGEKTSEQVLDYIRCMTITQNVNPLVYLSLTQENIDEVDKYINKKMTATWFSEQPNNHPGPSREVVTSELIYYWMIALNIPLECQKWHLNRLMTLIKVCSIKNTPPKKMTPKQLAARNSALNAKRIAKTRSGRG